MAPSVQVLLAVLAVTHAFAEDHVPQEVHAAASRLLASTNSRLLANSPPPDSHKDMLSALSKAFSPKCRGAYLSVLSLGLGCYGGMGACGSATCSTAWQSVKEMCKPSDMLMDKSVKTVAEEVLSMCGEAGTCEARAMQMAQSLQSDQTCGEESFCMSECKLTICSSISFTKSCCISVATDSADVLKMMCAEKKGRLRFEKLMNSKGCPCESDGLTDVPAAPASLPKGYEFIGKKGSGPDPSFKPCSGGSICKTHNVDLEYMGYAAWQSEAKARTNCEAWPECAGYWEQTNGNWWAMNEADVAAAEQSSDAANSNGAWTKVGQTCSANFVGQDLVGVDVQRTTAIGSSDAELDASCCSLCASNSDCQFWVRETGSVGPKTCWLKKDAETYVASMERRGALKQARRMLGVPTQSKPASRGLRGACVHC